MEPSYGGASYKEYLRSQFIYRDFKDLNLEKFEALSSQERPKANLCMFNFVQGHECMFGPEFCIYAHSIADIQEGDPSFAKTSSKSTRKSIFNNLGIWPTVTILSYFTPSEIMEISRVNKEAHYIAKKVFAMRCINLEKINIRSVKFFKRAEKLRITKDSLSFFQQYKDNFFEEILEHYKNLSKLVINLNWLFDERCKDALIDKISGFQLKSNIKTMLVEDSILNSYNLESLTRTQLVQNITQLKLPRNNLGDTGIAHIFTTDRLNHVRVLDLSSNLITVKGAQVIAESDNFPKLRSLYLRFNKIQNEGFQSLIISQNYPELQNLKLDINQIDQKGA